MIFRWIEIACLLLTFKSARDEIDAQWIFNSYFSATFINHRAWKDEIQFERPRNQKTKEIYDGTHQRDPTKEHRKLPKLITENMFGGQS